MIRVENVLKNSMVNMIIAFIILIAHTLIYSQEIKKSNKALENKFKNICWLMTWAENVYDTSTGFWLIEDVNGLYRVNASDADSGYTYRGLRLFCDKEFCYLTKPGKPDTVKVSFIKKNWISIEIFAPHLKGKNSNAYQVWNMKYRTFDEKYKCFVSKIYFDGPG